MVVEHAELRTRAEPLRPDLQTARDRRRADPSLADEGHRMGPAPSAAAKADSMRASSSERPISGGRAGVVGMSRKLPPGAGCDKRRRWLNKSVSDRVD